MKHALTLLPLAAALALSSPLAAAAEGDQHAVGIDLVRLIDKGQFEPNDGTLNLFYQGYLTKTSAFTLGYAWGPKSSIPELTYKIYTQKYLSGPFFEIGAATVYVKGTEYNNDPAVLGAFGMDYVPAEHLVVTTRVKAMAGIDNPHTGQKDILFLPSLSVMFTF